MENLNNINSMKDFLITFFIGNRKLSKLLSEVVKNRENTLYTETIGLPEMFVLPFLKEDGQTVEYVLNQNVNKEYIATISGCVYEKHIIHSGDYIVFTDRDGKIALKTLFIATTDIRIGYKKYRISKNTNIFIGRTPVNDISFEMSNFISREKHIAIRIDQEGDAFVEDLKRTVGVYVNGKLTHSKKLAVFDEIYIMGLSIVFLGDAIAVRDLKMECILPVMTGVTAKKIVDEKREVRYFVRAPRIMKSLEPEEIEVDGPPNPPAMDKTPVILTVGPSLTMALATIVSLGISLSNAISGGELSAIISSATMAVCMLLGSLMWPMLLRRYQKKRVIDEEEYRKNRYSSYIADIEKDLIAKRDRTIRLMNEKLNPSPEILSSMLESEVNKLRLWERSPEDNDFLDVRTGLGCRPFEVQLKVPRQGFQLYEDKMRDLASNLSEKYSFLRDVPLTLNIRENNSIGIIGEYENISKILNAIILNIIALHSYDEVKIILVTSLKEACNYEWIKNVPHIWSNDKKVRYFATSSEEVHFIFNIIEEVMKERKGANFNPSKAIPHYVLIVTEQCLIEKESLIRYIDNTENQIGLTAIFSYGEITKIPKFCKTIIQSDETRTGFYTKNKNANKFITFVPDKVNSDKVQIFAHNLAQLPIKYDLHALGIVDRVSFMQMYRAGNVNELDIEYHWDNNNSAKSLAAPIGVMAGGEVFSLDIHEAYHGCHGLVAGTTGSGKSEFLQEFILSLAINYSPREVAFVLVDFKGGDMARPFMKKTFSPALPHLAATITNLSGNTLYRALVSLEAEIKFRQRLFNEAAMALGVDKLDINSYHKYYKGGRLDTPLPHLVIIIDEFAQLKTQQPEFLAQLINVAQVGRSLGIHLILATQKPSGIVDPQIMSNSRFKVCLKVADKQDSVEMTGKADSATIKNPGRLYLQVGYDEIYECIQSGYSGADYIAMKKFIPEEQITVQMTDNTATPIHSAKLDLTVQKSNKTQLEAVVAELVALGLKKNIGVKPLWLDVLPEKIVLNMLSKGKKGLCTSTLGLVDYVRTQEQKTLTIDMAKIGHIALYGASGTGKTTFLQTLVYSMVCEYGYTPEELNLYAMDFGGRNLGDLEKLPHTGGIAFADEENKILELVSLLNGVIEERKILFSDNHCGTYTEYRSICKAALPAVLVLIDNFAPLKDKYMDVLDQLIEIVSEGKTYGVYFVITGNTRNSIYYKITEHIATYFTLKMNDPSNYLDILNARPPVLPEDISGRGITVINREVVEFQTAIACDEATESERNRAVCKKYEQLAEQWGGYKPIKLGACVNVNNAEKETSVDIRLKTALKKRNIPESIGNINDNLVLGTSKSGALLYGIKLSDDYRVCACANSEDDISIWHKNVLDNITEYSDRKLVFIDNGYGTFKNLANNYTECKYIKDNEELDIFIEELKPELNARLENDEKCLEHLFIIIGEFNAFFEMISDEQAAFMRKVFRYIDSPKYGIHFICGFNVCGKKSNDYLYMSLVVNVENYLIGPNCYEQASMKIEKLPLIQECNLADCYFCKQDKYTEIRW